MDRMDVPATLEANLVLAEKLPSLKLTKQKSLCSLWPTFLGRERSRSKIWLGLVLATSSWMLVCNYSSFTPSEPKSPKSKRDMPSRIISLSPNVTEILEGMGAFNQVIAVSDFCSYPPGVENLPRVGGWQNSSLEEVTSLRPELVIMSEAQAPFVNRQLQALGIETLVVPSQSLSDIFTAMRWIGKAVGRESRSKRLRTEVQTQLRSIARRTQGLPKHPVLCVVDRVPGTLRDLYTATEGSYLTQLIEIAGGRSIAPPAGSNYVKIGKEAVVKLNPEVIIDMVQGAKGRFGEDPIRIWSVLKEISAVRHGRVHAVRDMFVLHPSQFVVKTAELFAKLIHPEAYGGEFNE